MVAAANLSTARVTRSSWHRARSLVWAYPRLTVGAVLLVVLIILTLGAPLFVSHGPLDQNLAAVLQGPHFNHILGTDQLGRDILSRSLFGGRLILAVAVVSTAIALVIGVAIGLLAGYKVGTIDSILMRAMDGVIVFPDLILALAITYALGPSFWTVAAAIATVNVPKFARLVRSQVLSLRERDFIASAKVSGASTSRVLTKHLLPNVAEVIIVQAALTGGTAIFTAASLSFLGLGLPPPDPDWGGMLKDGYPFLGTQPLMSVIPGVFIFVAMLSFNLIGDGLRDWFDPKVLANSVRRHAKKAMAVVTLKAEAKVFAGTQRATAADAVESTAKSPGRQVRVPSEFRGETDDG